MIKGVKLFINNNDKSIKIGKIVQNKLLENGFELLDEGYDLAIAIGGDGSFLRMIKKNNFNCDIYYVGINSGTLGFLQEIKLDEIDKFIDELKNETYVVAEIGIQETTIEHKNGTSKFYSLNEIVIRDKMLKVAKLDIELESSLLEKFTGDGILVATSIGSTAYNLNFGGSIVYDTFTSLQITPIAPINSKAYRTLINSVIISDEKTVKITPNTDRNDLLVTIDGENNIYDGVINIKTKIGLKRLKFLRFKHHSFSQKINEKLLEN